MKFNALEFLNAVPNEDNDVGLMIGLSVCPGRC
jgi:hypothetical protein